MPSKRPRAAAVSASASRLWTTSGRRELVGKLELRVEELRAARPGSRSRGTLSSPVSPTATALGCASRSRSSSSLAAPVSPPDADRCRARRRPPSCASAIASAARQDSMPGADRDDRRHARRAAPAPTSVAAGSVARVQVRVRVGHAVAAACSMRSSSSATTSSGSSFANRARGSRSSWPGRERARRPPPAQIVVAREDDVLAPVVLPPSRNSSGPARKPS